MFCLSCQLRSKASSVEPRSAGGLFMFKGSRLHGHHVFAQEAELLSNFMKLVGLF